MPWLVHLLTASGAVMAWLALQAVVAADLRRAFYWLAAAMVVDAVDGLAARAVRVKERLPHVDGSRLDDLVDFVTFVFVPAWMVTAPGVVPPGWAPFVAAAILLSSAYGFSRTNAKTADHYFTGFPSYWNVVLLYLVAWRVPPSAGAALLLGLAVMVFVPIAYVYPSRTTVLQPLTLALGAVWGVVCLALIAQLPAPATPLLWLSLVFPAYYTILSIALTWRRARHGRIAVGDIRPTA
jgi:phosphatidylcholine synthase